MNVTLACYISSHHLLMMETNSKRGKRTPNWLVCSPEKSSLCPQHTSTGCSERRLTRHSFYSRNFLRKSCATCRENSRRGLITLLSTWCRAVAFFSASGRALSREVPTVKWMSNQPALWTPCTILYNFLKREFPLHYTLKCNSCLTRSILRLHYKHQSLNAVYGSNRCLFRDWWETHKYTTGIMQILCGTYTNHYAL
jgi:hypothetical protein